MNNRKGTKLVIRIGPEPTSETEQRMTLYPAKLVQ